MPYNQAGGFTIPSGTGASPIAGGGLNLPTGPNQAGVTGASGTYIIPGGGDIYNQQLGLYEKNYQNILGMLGQGLGNIAGGIPGVQQGYQSLLGNIENTLGLGAALGGSNWGVAGPAAQAIADTQKQQVAQAQQQAINQGLGGTSLPSQLQAQANAQAQRAYAGLGANLAQTVAGYQGSIGGAAVGAGMQGLGMANSLLGGAMGNLAGYRFGGLPQTGQFSYTGGGFGRGGGGGGGPLPPTNLPSNAYGGGMGGGAGGGGGYNFGGVPGQTGGIGGGGMQGSGSLPSGGGGYEGGYRPPGPGGAGQGGGMQGEGGAGAGLGDTGGMIDNGDGTFTDPYTGETLDYNGNPVQLETPPEGIDWGNSIPGLNETPDVAQGSPLDLSGLMTGANYGGFGGGYYYA